jgi:hypothetical protein
VLSIAIAIAQKMPFSPLPSAFHYHQRDDSRELNKHDDSYATYIYKGDEEKMGESRVLHAPKKKPAPKKKVAALSAPKKKPAPKKKVTAPKKKTPQRKKLRSLSSM